MKKFIVQSALVASIALGLVADMGCQARSGNPSTSLAVESVPQAILVAEAEKMMASDASLQVLDVRTPEEVAGGVIVGAKTIDWFDEGFVAQAEATLDKTKPVLVYCKLGGRGAKAANALTEKGFTKVYNLDGGITQWAAEGHPLQKQ